MTKQEFASMMDHSILGATVSRAQVKKFCEEAMEYGFPCVYVNHCDVAYAKSIVGDKCNVGSPVGFPQGVDSTRVKIFQGIDAIENGASELDIVINVGKLKEGDLDYVRNELTEFVRAMHEKKADVIIKVIIECVYLTHAEKITACEIVAESGADYVKQATGTTDNSFHLGDIKLMNAVVGDRIKVKSAGAIFNVEDAVGTIALGATRVGNDLGPQWLKEFDDCKWFEDVKVKK